MKDWKNRGESHLMANGVSTPCMCIVVVKYMK